MCVLNMRGIAREENMRVNTKDCALEASVDDLRIHAVIFVQKKLEMIEHV